MKHSNPIFYMKNKYVTSVHENDSQYFELVKSLLNCSKFIGANQTFSFQLLSVGGEEKEIAHAKRKTACLAIDFR